MYKVVIAITIINFVVTMIVLQVIVTLELFTLPSLPKQAGIVAVTSLLLGIFLFFKVLRFNLKEKE